VVAAQVLGEALLASGYIAYMGPLPGSYREKVHARVHLCVCVCVWCMDTCITI